MIRPAFEVGDESFSPTGDTDANGSVNLDDHADLEPCLAGPGGGLGAGCECFDFDSDNDVELDDFATFQASFTG